MALSKTPRPEVVSSSPSLLKLVVAPLVVAATAWQALASFVWVAPQTPLEDAVGPVLTAHFSPLFQQNWSIFAPDPAQGDYAVVAEYSDGQAVDLTETLREQGVHHVVPPRSWRMVGAYARDFVSAHAGLDDAANSAVAQDLTDADPGQDFGDYSTKEAALVRLASTYRCSDTTAPSGLRVKLRVSYQDVRPFGVADVPAPVDTVVTGWRPTTAVSATECAAAPWPR